MVESTTSLSESGDFPLKRLFEEVLIQVLADFAIDQLQSLIEWLNTAPWQVWFA